MTDLNTGLVWQRSDSQNAAGRTFQQAVDYCSILNLADHTDWRLPTRLELVSLVDLGVSGTAPSISSAYFSDCRSYYYWSSST